jgi:beta-galactosidase
MIFKKKIALLFCLFFFSLLYVCAQKHIENEISVLNFDHNWEFIKDADTSITPALFKSSSQKNSKWSEVSLPHTANLEPIVKTAQQWEGICLYRKFFEVTSKDKGKYIAIQIDAAMSEADVYLNGKHIFNHIGGYLPFRMDISPYVKYGAQNCIVIRLNNKDNSQIPPGKPIQDLDFNYYSGIYRNAWLIIKNKVHLSDAVGVDHVNGGGVLLHYSDVSTASANLQVKCEVQNDLSQSKLVSIKTVLRDDKGTIVDENSTAALPVDGNNSRSFNQQIRITDPRLWSPDRPYLYHLLVYVINNRQIIDSVNIKTGIRDIRFKGDGFFLNGAKILIRGTNRHQEYPYIGNALSDNAQYRDACKIKEAGFNFVRCSHYPPSPAFLDACDELGLLVMDSTPGWQYFGDAPFQQNSLQNIRDMVHRDRNHPSIVVWEASLNETGMKRDYMVKANDEVHAELPYATTFTCGWIDDVYDVFIPARQHAKAPDYWKKYNKDKPLLIAEYGDWEYYAQNAGFNQTEYQNLTKEEKSSRQIRAYGQERLLQQALNYQEAHNDNLYNHMVGDLIWLMFDYKRGYATDLQTSGIMDFFRVPKFSFYFFRSQLDAAKGKPMIFIASYWNDANDKTVKVYSNCDEVELRLNGTLIARQKPDTGRNSNNLPHPPFTFHVANYAPGTLDATGYINGQKAAATEVKTPGKPYKIVLRPDYSGKTLQANSKDAVFVYADVVDMNGTVVPDAVNQISFSVEGPGEIIGDRTVKAEAGIAPVLLMGSEKPGTIKIKAIANGLEGGELPIKSTNK